MPCNCILVGILTLTPMRIRLKATLLFTGFVAALSAQTSGIKDVRTVSPSSPSHDTALMADIDSAVNSQLIEKIPEMLEMVALAPQSKARYTNYTRAAIDPRTQLAEEWSDSLNGYEVIEVYNTSAQPGDEGYRKGGLQSYVTIKLNKPAMWLRDPRWRNELCLSINGIPFPEVRPLFFNNDSVFRFYLERGDSAQTTVAWDIIQQIRDWNFTRKVKVSISTPTLPAIPVKADKATVFEFIIIYKTGIFIFLVVAGLLGFIYVRFRNTLLFRDHPGDRVNDKTFLPAYSLARVQLGFWMLIILLSESYIWAITGVLPDLTTSSLLLLGLSVGTTALSSMVGYANEIPVNQTSGNFFTDIISDATRVPSLHRLQMVIWTVIIGVYFVRETWLHFSMPDLSENLLILMGISSGTYVVFKSQESKHKTVRKLSNDNTTSPVTTPTEEVTDEDEPAVG